MENSILKIELERLGLEKKAGEITAKTGVNVWTVYRHLDGTRKVSPADAIKYEIGLGIPRASLRPDIFGDVASQRGANAQV